MAEKPSAEKVTAAINAFLSTMRRESIRRHGEARAPVWDNMTPADRQILAKAVIAALIAKPVETRPVEPS